MNEINEMNEMKWNHEIMIEWRNEWMNEWMNENENENENEKENENEVKWREVNDWMNEWINEWMTCGCVNNLGLWSSSGPDFVAFLWQPRPNERAPLERLRTGAQHRNILLEDDLPHVQMFRFEGGWFRKAWSRRRLIEARNQKGQSRKNRCRTRNDMSLSKPPVSCAC